MCSGIGSPGLGRGVALRSDQHSTEGDLEVNFPLHTRRRVSKGLEQLQRPAEVADCFR
jgi:hypothetical protein